VAKANAILVAKKIKWYQRLNQILNKQLLIEAPLPKQ